MNQTSLSIKYYTIGRVTRGSGGGTRGGDIQTSSMAHTIGSGAFLSGGESAVV